jgi:hypothetical protein
MLKLNKLIMSYFEKKPGTFVLIITTVTSILVFLSSYQNNMSHLANYDAIARLNIARKIIDSLTPGFGQLGGIWLPLPQLLMLPFIWNDFLWRSGIAGSIISMVAFIASSWLVYQTTYTLTQNKWAGLLGSLVFITNINLLYYQSTAMSESFFILTLTGTLFFLTRWSQQFKVLDLLGAGIFVMLATLTRYEGYFLFAAAVIFVAVYAFFKFRRQKFSKVEGTLVLFTTLAGFGIAVWMIYSALIYKDPVYFLNLYSGKKEIIEKNESTTSLPSEFLSNPESQRGIQKAVLSYSWATALMNGVIVTAAGVIIAVITLLVSAVRLLQKRAPPATLIIPFIFVVVFTLMIFGYQRGLIPGIETPPLDWSTFLSKVFNQASHSNIRYGLITLPFIAILLGMMYGRNFLLSLALFVTVAVQLITTYQTPYFFIFQIPKADSYAILPYAEWFRQNYDQGLVLVSANRHEPFMLQTNLPYKTFIYEGNRELWFNSLNNPATYASWVVYNSEQSGDAIKEQLKSVKSLERNFNLVYDKQGIKIYKIKNKPERDVK